MRRFASQHSISSNRIYQFFVECLYIGSCAGQNTTTTPALRMSDPPVTRKKNQSNHLSDLVMNGVMSGGKKPSIGSQATIPVPRNLRFPGSHHSVFSGGSTGSTGNTFSDSGNRNTKDRSKIASSIDGWV